MSYSSQWFGQDLIDLYLVISKLLFNLAIIHKKVKEIVNSGKIQEGVNCAN